MNTAFAKYRKFLIPLIIAIIAAPILITTTNKTKESVKGVGTAIKPGFGVNISSSGTWSMPVYLCEDLETCVEGIDSGYRWKTYGGGASEETSVHIESTDECQNYTYAKVYVHSGWGSYERDYSLSLEQVPIRVGKKVMSDGAKEIEVLLVPLDDCALSFYKVGSFVDRQNL